MECITTWLKVCLSETFGSQHVHHVRIVGPRFCGKSSIARRFVTRAALNEDPGSTEGTEVSVAKLRQDLFVLYDSENNFDTEYNSGVKRLNPSSKHITLKPPDALVFVIDGTDVGRLPLTFKILREVADHYYKIDTLLILVNKSGEQDFTSTGLRTMPSLARWMSPKRQGLREGDSPLISPTARECLESPLLRPKDSPTGSVGMHYPTASVGDKYVTLQQVGKLMTHPTLLQKEWKAFYCSAKTGKGIDEAFAWLATTLSFSS